MGLSLKSKRVVVTDGREIGALTTSNLVADVSGTVVMDVVVTVDQVAVAVVVTGCVVLAVLARLGGKSKLEVHMMCSFL